MLKKISLALLLVLLSANLAYAATFQTGDKIIVSDPLTDDSYYAGETVYIDGPITGDLFVAGRIVKINADISGDLTVAAQYVTINGNIGDDVRILAQDLQLDATIGDDLLAAGDSFLLSKNSSVGGSVFASGNILSAYGKVTGDMNIAFATTILGGEVTGNVISNVGETFDLTGDAKINGNLSYKNEEELKIDETLVVGEIVFNEVQILPSGEEVEVAAKTFLGALLGAVAAFKIFGYLGLLVVGLIYILVAPNAFRSINKKTKDKTLKSLLYGLFFAIGVPFVSILLLCSIIGIRLASIAMLAWLLLWPFAKLFAGYYVGTLLFKPKKEPRFWRDFLTFALGLFIVFAIQLIPIFGWLIYFALALIGLGGLVIFKMDMFSSLKKEKVV